MTPYSDRIIAGSDFKDERGTVRFVNDFELTKLKRFYIIEHPKAKVIRAWQGHRFEQKYFFTLEGEWLFYIIKIDNWIKPSNDLIPEVFKLSQTMNSVLRIPSGFVTGFQNLSKNGKMLIFSNKSLSNSIIDDYRYDKNYFCNIKW